MTGWLLDTFVYTGLLIALVLVLRRPAARYFGPQLAYALWGLPFLRLLLPPVVLPASFAPQAPAAEMAVGQGVQGGPVVMILAEPAPLVTWPMLSLIVWLGGALAFLAWRVVTYRWMRQDLLDPARPVGSVGRIRLVETPEVTAPVAFGVFDKVVALPVLFMAQPDIAARDLAIAHELEHHRGRDLAANFAAQVLLALHWFNPIAWYGWRAMRRDQEAACDARMLTGRGREERARYAELIAGTAAGRPLALAAPMACPVLGDASIIHRLRSLTMSDISPRRRWFGRALIGSCAFALPLTASISYAAQAQDVPVPPAPPAPPAAIAPPAPLAPPEAPQLRERRVERVITQRGDGARPGRERIARRFAMRPGIAPVPPVARVPRVEFRGFTGPLGDADYQRRMDEWSREMEEWSRKYGAKWGREMGEWGKRFGAQQARQAQRIVRVERLGQQRLALAERLRDMPRISVDCDGKDGASETTLPDGRRQVIVCHRAVAGQALGGLRSARERIAADSHLSDETRREVLRDLDGEIAQLQQNGAE